MKYWPIAVNVRFNTLVLGESGKCSLPRHLLQFAHCHLQESLKSKSYVQSTATSGACSSSVATPTVTGQEQSKLDLTLKKMEQLKTWDKSKTCTLRSWAQSPWCLMFLTVLQIPHFNTLKERHTLSLQLSLQD